VFAELMGGGGREIVEAHDGAAHEAYVHALYVPRVVRTGCLTVDITASRYWVEGREVTEYMPRSWTVLRTLALRLGTVVSSDELWLAMQGPLVPKIHSKHYFNSAIHYLRQSLGPASRLIETRVDLGYMLRAEEP
jgi:DNA-binding response OmpR family regulator